MVFIYKLIIKLLFKLNNCTRVDEIKILKQVLCSNYLCFCAI